MFGYLECSTGRDHGFKGKDATVIINVGHGHGHGEWPVDAWGHPETTSCTSCNYVTLHDSQGASITLASPHSHHKPGLGLNRCKN